MDGSVRWHSYQYGFNLGDGVAGHYIRNGASIGGHIAVPSNSLWVKCDGSGNLYSNLISGGVSTSYSTYFK